MVLKKTHALTKGGGCRSPLYKENSMSRRSSIIVGAAIAVVLSFGAAGAGATSVNVTASAPNDVGIYLAKAIVVQLGDIDIATAGGAATGLQRITAASRVVCGEVDGHTMNADRAKIFATCVKRATNYAVGNVNAPLLTDAAAAH